MNTQPRTPYPWQAEGTKFLLEGGSLLAFDPGLGKTFSALMADKAAQADLYSPLPLLIGCPSVAVGVWLRECRDVYPDAVVHVVSSGRPIPAGIDIAICTHDLPKTSTVLAMLLSRSWRRVIIDEAHRLKNRTAQRTALWLTGVRPIVSRAAFKPWLLTGTPAPNGRPDELWPLVTATQPDRLKPLQEFEAFTRYFCTFKMQRRGNGAAPIRVIAGADPATRPDLVRRLKGWMYRVRKSDAGMPKKLVHTIPVQLGALEEYDEIMSTREGRALAHAIKTGDTVQLGSMELNLARLRSTLSKAKATAGVDWIADLLESGEKKVVAFAWHVEAIMLMERMLEERGITSVRVTGSLSAKDKTRAEDAFQRPDGPQVFLGQIAAAGTAITLTAASRVVMVEYTFVPGDNAQAEDRVDRIGQKETVVVDYLVADGTLDEAVLGIVRSKAKGINALGA